MLLTTVSFIDLQKVSEARIRVHPDGRGGIRTGQVNAPELPFPDWHLLWPVSWTERSNPVDSASRVRKDPLAGIYYFANCIFWLPRSFGIWLVYPGSSFISFPVGFNKWYYMFLQMYSALLRHPYPYWKPFLFKIHLLPLQLKLGAHVQRTM